MDAVECHCGYLLLVSNVELLRGYGVRKIFSILIMPNERAEDLLRPSLASPRVGNVFCAIIIFKIVWQRKIMKSMYNG